MEDNKDNSVKETEQKPQEQTEGKKPSTASLR